MPEHDLIQQQERFRSFLQELGVEGRRSMAERFGVTERTVQRWAKEPGTGQSRGFIPKNRIGTPLKEWPRAEIRRANTARMVNDGLSQKGLGGVSGKVYVERFKTPSHAIEYLKTLRQNLGDKFLGSHYVSARLVMLDDGWGVEVELATRYGPAGGDARGVEGGSFLADDLFGGPLDSDLF